MCDPSVNDKRGGSSRGGNTWGCNCNTLGKIIPGGSILTPGGTIIPGGHNYTWGAQFFQSPFLIRDVEKLIIH